MLVEAVSISFYDFFTFLSRFPMSTILDLITVQNTRANYSTKHQSKQFTIHQGKTSQACSSASKILAAFILTKINITDIDKYQFCNIGGTTLLGCARPTQRPININTNRQAQATPSAGRPSRLPCP